MPRALEKDLKICNRATEGPWEAVETMLSTIKDRVVNSELEGICDMVGYTGVDTNADAEFIATAREGWPEAIKRALIAEAEVELLRKQLLIAAKEITSTADGYDLCPTEFDEEMTCTCHSDIAQVYNCWRLRWRNKAEELL